MVDSDRNSRCAQVMVSAANAGEDDVDLTARRPWSDHDRWLIRRSITRLEEAQNAVWRDFRSKSEGIFTGRACGAGHLLPLINNRLLIGGVGAGTAGKDLG
jgi:hypothetical protein